jgi:hypothetical protein
LFRKNMTTLDLKKNRHFFAKQNLVKIAEKSDHNIDPGVGAAPEHAEPPEVVDADSGGGRHGDGRSDAADGLGAGQVSGHGGRLSRRGRGHRAGLLLRLLVALPEIENLGGGKYVYLNGLPGLGIFWYSHLFSITLFHEPQLSP